MLTHAPIKAAQYVRMSTDLQAESPAVQKATIADYADRHGFEIVRTYLDEGRSGLQLRGRPGLQKLLVDVLGGEPQFAAILVYDVSRWGRFQDADEAAHLEFLCRSAGVPIHYCAEQFANDGSLSATILKSLKRAMAGEYSRELSAKVFAGQCNLARQGFKMGGKRRYGFNRMLVASNGAPKGLLGDGEQKHLRTDHVILVPGPPNEVATVRRIFRLCAHKGLSTRQIARRLNDEGSSNVSGGRWTATGVGQILRSETYTGVLVYAKSSKKLGTREVANDPSQWIRCDGAIEPIVNQRLFDAAKRGLAARQWSQSDEQLLDKLRKLHQRLGRLSVRDVLKEPGFPMPTTYRHRFGSFTHACELVGYVRPTLPYAGIHPTLLFRAFDILEDAVAAIAGAGGVAEPIDGGLLLIDGNERLGVTAHRPTTYAKYTTWRVLLRHGFGVDYLLVSLLDRFGGIQPGFALLPSSRFGQSRTAYISESRPRAANNRFDRLRNLYGLIAAARAPT